MASWISATSLTSFSTWEIEYSLVETNLESTGAEIKGCDIFSSQKLANTCSFVGGHIAQQGKISTAKCSWMNLLNVLQEAIHHSFIKFCIYCFALWYEFFVHYGLSVE
jgi:aerobic-type carbon monoxide dehydrogenase small subunit (CoxS/CutS family)